MQLDETVAKRIYEDTTSEMTRKHGFDTAWFGERVEDDALVVGYRSGAVSDLSDNTLLRPGHGLGGLVFASSKIQSVDHYTAAANITHHYDERIEAESLRRVIGAPVWAEGECVGVIMGGSRAGATFGSTAGEMIEAVAKRMSDALVAALLRERLAALEAAVKQTALQLRELESRTGSTLGGIRCRERDVLNRVALGHTNREIAEGMQLSECTVKSYLRNAMQRLGARNRTEAIAFARNAGLI
jgi:DNA-binding CsgD family transcriptional regulator/putative methionine-R-sulfoxide reductase with GAF domain